MGIFDKKFNKKNDGNRKIKIKFIKKEREIDEHEQFLKPEEPMVIKIGAETVEKAPKSKKTPSAKSDVKVVATKTKPPVTKSEAAKKELVTGKKATSEKPDAKKKATVKAKSEATATKTNASPKIKISLEEDNDEYTKGAVTVSEGKETGVGTFDIQRAKDGRFFFNLYASNHVVIAYSQIYSSTSAAMTGIKSIIANAANTPIEDNTLKKPVSLPCPKWEIYIDKAGEYRFRLYATNGLCICHSAHGYSTKSGCKGGIESIGRFASEAAKIDKSYLK